MAEEQSFDDDIETYKENNCKLAFALNDARKEVNKLQFEILLKNREVQEFHEQITLLKRELAERDNSINTWRTSFIEMMQQNTQNYTNLMRKVGLVPQKVPANSSNIQNVDIKPILQPAIVLQPQQSSNIGQRHRQPLAKINHSPQNRLPDLTEESTIHNTSSLPDLSNLSDAMDEIENSTPKMAQIARKFNRRRASLPPPPSPSEIARSLSPAKASPKRSTRSRPSRRAAPKSLSEPKLGTKLRREK